MSRAIVYRSLGPPSVLEYVKDWPVQPRKPSEVKINIKSTSVNPVDVKQRSSGKTVVFPKVPGGDFAGVVVEADPTSKFKEGDKVFALTKAYYGDDPLGAYTEYGNIKEEWLAAVPDNLSIDTEAGAVPLVSLTAFQALSSADLQPGARVLIHAASGGVGHLAVQLAKVHWGAYVVGTAGPKKQDFVKSLGADEVVDYTSEDFEERYKAPDQHFDAIVDLVGGESELKSYNILKPNGTFAHIRNTGTKAERLEAGKSWKGRKYTVTLVQPNGEQLGIIAQLLADGKLKVKIDSVYPLEKAREAHEHLESGNHFVKIVIQI